MQKISIHNEEKVKELLENNWEKTFRYSQIENAIYKNFITDFDEMTTLSKNVRELLKENCFFDSLTLDQEISSDNEQTTKMLWKTSTWEFIESVIMRHLSWRVTLCVSCQAGCPMACSFCATWKLGLQKNLTNILCCKNDKLWMSKTKKYSIYVNVRTFFKLQCCKRSYTVCFTSKKIWFMK